MIDVSGSHQVFFPSNEVFGSWAIQELGNPSVLFKKKKILIQSTSSHGANGVNYFNSLDPQTSNLSGRQDFQ